MLTTYGSQPEGRTRNRSAGPGWSVDRLVDGTSLAVVRIALGVVATLSAVRTLAYGWADSLYARPGHRFTYLWMGWVPQPSPVGIRLLAVAVGAAGIAVALGWRTRCSAAVLLVTFGWVELIDATTYLNHYWFVTLLAALTVVAPLGATLSLDARRRGPRPVATGWVWLLRFQVGVIYAFAGLAKLQADWLIHALPLRLWLPARADLPLVGPLLAQPITAHVLAVAGAAFDVSIVGLLLWRRTRLAGWLALVGFHVATWVLFPIGVFPWLMIGVATIFFAPDWPRTLTAGFRARRRSASVRPTDVSPIAASSPARHPADGRGSPSGVVSAGPAVRLLAMGGAAVWMVVQLALPLRHLAYPGDHRWTAEGYRFGWNVLLVERAGSVTFLVHEPATGRSWTADPSMLYTRSQLRVMAGEPDLIAQAARTIADDEATRGHEVEVRVDAFLSLNGRPAERWIDPSVDLAATRPGLGAKPWVLGPQ